jgi:hypothetical protein
MIPKSSHKCEPSVFLKVLVSSTQAEGSSKLKRRHGLSRVLMTGETADADEKDEDFIVNVMPGLIEGYAAEDTYHADETGLFFKCLPDKTYGSSDEKCHGRNKSKNRLTVMVRAFNTALENVYELYTKLVGSKNKNIVDTTKKVYLLIGVDWKVRQLGFGLATLASQNKKDSLGIFFFIYAHIACYFSKRSRLNPTFSDLNFFCTFAGIKKQKYGH